MSNKTPYVQITIRHSKREQKIAIRVKGCNFESGEAFEKLPKAQQELMLMAFKMVGATENATGQVE